MTTKDNFEVHTLEYIDKDSKNYRRWSEGLKMYITKNNVTITLNEDEIQQLVKSLPRTIGGSY